jgi:hypothetical protein
MYDVFAVGLRKYCFLFAQILLMIRNRVQIFLRKNYFLLATI